MEKVLEHWLQIYNDDIEMKCEPQTEKRSSEVQIFYLKIPASTVITEYIWIRLRNKKFDYD